MVTRPAKCLDMAQTGGSVAHGLTSKRALTLAPAESGRNTDDDGPRADAVNRLPRQRTVTRWPPGIITGSSTSTS